MIELYPLVKWLHIVSSTILFGTGIGTAFHMYATYRRGDARVIAVTAKNVVLADWLFTATSGVAQPVTGLMLIWLAGYELTEPWLLATYALYAIAAVCWFRVVWLQYRLRDSAVDAVAAGTGLAEADHALMRQWFWLGWPAFLSLLAIFYLMVAKPD